ncbi:helix-turn-helix transcriptional regulator [Streptomyces xanthophaeus]|uniref:helix-turn-helix transcriptional regulator n=1 Tax=Streptomyces xanthophaeus TaxID=67385 RepID=UPI0026483C95|nr:response regulator transcription factor [Streptomyces xanthophaeus]WKD31233.1 response regulator transcription factor [Streptomyces xanthophaeus]
MGVLVTAEDALTAEGARARLRDYAGLRPLPAAERHRADVHLVFADRFTGATLDLLRSLAADAHDPGAGAVLVTGEVPDRYVLPAVQYGLRSVVARTAAGFDAVAEAVRETARGNAVLPSGLQGALIDQMLGLRSSVLEPAGLTFSGLGIREVEVLRLLAEGLDTADIGRRLNYSERTIKQMISGVTGRLGLRNRTQAVAYASRHGAL